MNPYNNYNMGMNNFYPNQFSTLTQPQMPTQNLIRVNGIDGAEEYAEKYIELKVNNPQWAKLYHDMSNQELLHAQNFKEMGESIYAEMKNTYMPEETEEKWEHCMRKYADRVAKIKVMLSM